MNIETERLILRTLRLGDEVRLHEYRNKKEVSKFQSWTRFSQREARNLVTYTLNHPYEGEPKQKTQLAVTLKDGTMIGDLHLETVSKTCLTIGYTLESVYWGMGYGREAVRGLLAYIKETFPHNKVIAYIYKENDRSRRLLLDLGFVKFDESFFYHDEGYVLYLRGGNKK